MFYVVDSHTGRGLTPCQLPASNDLLCLGIELLNDILILDVDEDISLVIDLRKLGLAWQRYLSQQCD